MRRLHITNSLTNTDHDSLKRYFKDISSYRLLTAEEEVFLAKKIKAGDKASLQQLINCNLRFVVSVAKKYDRQGVLLADLISAGNIGLIKAAERFDETRGIKFISFAVWWIRHNIMLTIEEHGQVIRLPSGQSAGMYEVKKGQAYLEQELGRSPSILEIATQTGLTLEKVTHHLSDVHKSISLETEDDEGKPGHLNYLEDQMFDSPDKAVQHEYLQKAIAQLFNSLTEQQSFVLNKHYGLNGNTPQLLEDIAVQLKLSVDTVKKIKFVALHRLSLNRNLKHLKE